MKTLALLTLTLSLAGGCKKTEESRTATDVEREPAPAVEASPPAGPARSDAKRLATLDTCELTSTYIFASLAMNFDQSALGAGSTLAPKTREYWKIRCVQCVGEDFSHGNCPVEYAWDCSGVALSLDGLDAGKPLAPPYIRSLNVKPIESGKAVREAIDQLLARLDDPNRYGYLDKDATRELVLSMKKEASKLSDVEIGKAWATETERSCKLAGAKACSPLRAALQRISA